MSHDETLVSVRLSRETIALVQDVADLDDSSAAQIIRDAVAKHLEKLHAAMKEIGFTKLDIFNTSEKLFFVGCVGNDRWRALTDDEMQQLRQLVADDA